MKYKPGDWITIDISDLLPNADWDTKRCSAEVIIPSEDFCYVWLNQPLFKQNFPVYKILIENKRINND